MRRLLPWALLLALLMIAQSLLVVLTLHHEHARAQEEADAAAAEASAALRSELLSSMQSLQLLLWDQPAATAWPAGAAELLRTRYELLRLERRDAALALTLALDTPLGEPLFVVLPRAHLMVDTEVACRAAQRTAAPQFSRSFFVPMRGGLGIEVIDVCVPIAGDGRDRYLVATLSLAGVLERALGATTSRHEFSLVEGDGTRLARAGIQRGADFGGVVGIIVDDDDAPGLALDFEPAACALELAQGFAGGFYIQPQQADDCQRSQRVANIVQAWHAQLHARRRAARDGQMLDAIAELFRVTHVRARDARDAFGQRAQHHRAVRDGFVAGHAQAARKRLAARGDPSGGLCGSGTAHAEAPAPGVDASDTARGAASPASATTASSAFSRRAFCSTRPTVMRRHCGSP